jgi:AraC-like DNA-binding protein
MDLVNATIKNLCSMLYIDADVEMIMHDRNANENIGPNIVRMNNIHKKTLTANPFVHSIYIYNGYSGHFYSSYQGLLFKDKNLDSLVESASPLPVLRPVFRQIEYNGKSVDVLSYFVYNTIDQDDMLRGCLVINVTIDWLVENIYALNQDESGGEMVLLISDGQLVTSQNPISREIRDIVSIDLKDKPTLEWEEKTVAGEPYFISYAPIGTSGITLVMANPQSSADRYLGQIRLNIILITLVFALLAVLFALPVSSNIYNPLGNLVNWVQESFGETQGSANEMDYLQNIYKAHQKYEKEMSSSLSSLRQAWLADLLADSASVSEEDMKAGCVAHNLSLLKEGLFLVCVLSIDKAKGFEQTASLEDKDLLKYVMTNVFTEIIGEAFPNEGVKLQGLGAAFAIKVPSIEDTETLLPLAREAGAYLMKHFAVSITFAFSGTSENYKDLTALVAEAEQNASYRFVFGRNSIITPEMASSRIQGPTTQALKATEKKLSDAVKECDPKAASQALDSFFAEVGKLKYNSILVALLRLIVTINEQGDRSNGAYVNLDSLTRNFFQLETLDEARQELDIALADYTKKKPSLKTSERRAKIIEAAKAIISEKHQDASLCLDSIADMCKISSKHLSLIFKESEGMSVAERINETRMLKAAELLVSSNLSIKDISSMIGMSNQTYFYSLFRKKFGVSPKTYAIMKATSKNDDSLENGDEKEDAPED